MDAGQRMSLNRELFGRVAPTYDRLGYLAVAARHLAAQVAQLAQVALPGSAPGRDVLDVACGTGEVALTLAAGGARVVGTDFARPMIEVARARAAAAQVPAQFRVADAGALPFPDGSFDVVTCGAGLFFLPDMPGALREWRRVLRPGGVVAFTTFGRGLLGDFPGLWRARLERRDLKAAAPPLGRVPDVGTAGGLLRGAGFTGVQVRLDVLPYTLPSAGARWADIQAGMEGDALRTLTEAEVAAVRDAHLKDLGPLFEGGPVTVPVPVLLGMGQVPGPPSL